MPDGRRKLSSWKEIAAYLYCDESTARRWERKVKLPVYRAGGSKGSSVFAYTEEIDEWLRGQNAADLKSSNYRLDGNVRASQEMGSGEGLASSVVKRGEAPEASTPGTHLLQAPSSMPKYSEPQASQLNSSLWKYAFIGTVVLLAFGIASLLWGGVRLTSSPLSKPTVTSVAPSTPLRRNLDQTVTVNGGDFQDGLTVTVYYPGGVGRLSGTQLQDITSTSFQMVVLLGMPGNYSIVVNNPDGTHSNRFTFTVNRDPKLPAS